MIFCITYRKTLFGKEKNKKLSIVLFAIDMRRGVLKYVYLRNKIASMQCFCVNRLFEGNFNDWKVMLLLIANTKEKVSCLIIILQ